MLSLFNLINLIFPLLLAAPVVAGFLFVKASPRPHHWCFLVGSAIIFVNSIVVIIPSIMATPLPETRHLVLRALSIVGGILSAYGIMGHAFAYLRMSRYFDERGFPRNHDDGGDSR